MIKSLALGLLGGGSLMSTAIAAPCVGAGFDVPFPGAVAVETLHADVPSAQFPGLWQQGQIDGYAYQIFANATGVLQDYQIPSAWSIALDCQQSPCLREVKGSPPSLAWTASRRLEKCIAPSIVVAPVALSKPAAASDAPKPDPAKPTPTIPAPAEPVTAKPEPTKFVPAEPILAKPAPAEPVPAKPAPTESAPAEPILTKPATAEPATAKPTPEEPIPTKPATAKSAAAEPVPTKPAETKPATLAPLPSGPAVPTVSAKTSDSDTVTEGRLLPEKADQCVGPHDLGSAAVSCKLASIPEADPVVTLQHLLVLAGADPGLVDGEYGPQTQSAVLQVLGFAGRNLEVSEAITAVKAFLCLHKQ